MLLPLQGDDLMLPSLPRVLPWAMSFLPFQGVTLGYELSALSGRY